MIKTTRGSNSPYLETECPLKQFLNEMWLDDQNIAYLKTYMQIRLHFRIAKELDSRHEAIERNLLKNYNSKLRPNETGE